MKFLGFGDMLLRLNPEGYLRFSQADRMQVNYTGAEANVCVSLAHMGVDSEFVTRLPENAIADAAIAELRKHSVGVSHIVRGGERIGVFYVEKGAAQRPSTIVYDRTGTAIATARSEDFNWNEIFKDIDWFHWTGITPALGAKLPDICGEALQIAKRKGIRISCDLNYRAKLWTPEKAGEVMRRLLPYVDVLIANEEDSEKVLGIHAEATNVTRGLLNRDGYIDVARKLSEAYPIKAVGITLRKSISASDNEWSAMLYKDGKAYFSRVYPIHIVDRVGGGDAFAAGLIYALMNDLDAQETIEYAAAASCLKQTIEMDFNLCTADEIKRLANGDSSGRIQR